MLRQLQTCLYKFGHDLKNLWRKSEQLSYKFRFFFRLEEVKALAAIVVYISAFAAAEVEDVQSLTDKIDLPH